MRIRVLLVLLCVGSPGAASAGLVNGGFTAGLDGWSAPPGIATWSGEDASGLATSGSLTIVNALPAAGSDVGLSQCVEVGTTVTSFVVAQRYFFPAGQASTGSAWVGMTWYPGTSCSGSPVDSLWVHFGDSFSQTGVWHEAVWVQQREPLAAGSVRVDAFVRRNGAGGVLEARLDDLVFEVNAAVRLRGRFDVGVTWKTPDGNVGAGRPVVVGAESADFWFFTPSNTEMIVKVLDGCPINDRFWVFAAGLTNVETLWSVVDDSTWGRVIYTTPMGPAFTPVQDTSAFETCP